MSNAVKAADMKRVIFWLAEKTEKMTDDWHGQCRACCLFSLANFLRILDLAGIVLNDEEATRAQDAGSKFLRLYQQLAQEASLDKRSFGE